MQSGCGLDKSINNISNLKNNLKNESTTKSGVKLINPVTHTKAYLYGIENDNGYIFIYSTLEDIDSTSVILKGQLIYIMFIVLFFASLVAYFLSKKITKPIVEITKKAEEMGKGNYDIVFGGSGTLEIDALSKTLNNTCKDMQKIEELRRDLLANVSHDLKTPLTMIKAYAEMVRDITYKDPEKREKNLNVIIDETDRLTILVNDLLELSKMQSEGEKNLNLEEYDLIGEIKNILSKYDIIKETENYNFVLDAPGKAIVKADKNKINQVIYNLVNNAINYTGKDKLVTIKVTENKTNYLVEIIDTGKGIKNDDLPYIWDKYYKNDKNHQRNVVGTGVGLSIVRNILEQHKFKYGVNSKKNKGTTFYFEISK
jgi:signal transduction histidine kinase